MTVWGYNMHVMLCMMVWTRTECNLCIPSALLIINLYYIIVYKQQPNRHHTNTAIVDDAVSDIM